jgi:hypothetical protein
MARGRELGELDERERERERSGELKIRAFGGEGKRERTAPLCLRGGVRKYSGTAKLPPHLFPFFSSNIFLFCGWLLVSNRLLAFFRRYKYFGVAEKINFRDLIWRGTDKRCVVARH